MNVVKNKYKVLAPRVGYLADPVVLIQAWKKASAYIRKHNWYNDSLELDCSSVDLESQAGKWSQSLTAGTYSPSPMRMVLAPKNSKWGFLPNGDWGPLSNESTHLRPLAHVGIQDQTISTAVMMLLAECVESAQGDTSQPIDSVASRKRVHSYGNRLYCRWSKFEGNARAHFSWANAETYSRYFQDYEAYVRRSLRVAEKANANLPGSSLYLVKLDIESFYDNVDRRRLVDVLRTEYELFTSNFVGIPTSSIRFWDTVSRSLSFEWDANDQNRFDDLLKGGTAPKGLPQGLVASGFFANAYMLDFDRAVGRKIDKSVRLRSGYEFTLHDYARYVDDINIVVSVQSGDSVASARDVAKQVALWVNSVLNSSVNVDADNGKRLRLNEGKTDAEPFTTVGRVSGVGERMRQLQENLSGPFDYSTLVDLAAGLDGLMSLAELQSAAVTGTTSDLALAEVGQRRIEVRDDTLTRFSAYRLAKTLRLRRSMTDVTAFGGAVDPEVAFDHEFEATARRFVSAWSRNPSLVTVLRYGMDLYPSVEILEPVLAALKTKLCGDADRSGRRTAEYVLSELFRAGAVETGLQSPTDEAAQLKLEAYRARLEEEAEVVMRVPESSRPWYVQQQAMLFLAFRRNDDFERTRKPALRRHRALLDIMSSSPKPVDLPMEEAIAISLVARQAGLDDRVYVAWFRKSAEKWGRPERHAALRLLGQLDDTLYRTVSTSAKVLALTRIVPFLSYEVSEGAESSGPLRPDTFLPASTVLRHRDNPFTGENALLKLAHGLTLEMRDSEILPADVTPLSVRLRCSDWKEIQNPYLDNLIVELRPADARRDPRYETPSWCSESMAWMYAIGRVLRAMATSDPDYTSRKWIASEDLKAYRGILSSWQKRQVGLIHTGNAMAGSAAPITPWFSELLMRLLQWPGLEVSEAHLSGWSRVGSPTALARLIGKRIDYQKELYGRSSGMPVYVFPVEFPLRKAGELRVALVQPLLPQQNDFYAHGPGFDDAGFRARHRKHLAAVAHLVHRKLAAHDSAIEIRSESLVDLIVFPELSVGPEDQDLIRSLSDATGAIVLFGLTKTTLPNDLAPINICRWLIPQRRNGRRSWLEVDQGKGYLTKAEKESGYASWRPYQAIIELQGDAGDFRLTGSICFDATDISLAADLKDHTHMFVVCAMNRDVKTFDSMVAALRYHMYQHVLIANIGEFGGSTAQAPYDVESQRLVAHVHGSQQVAVSVFSVPMEHFGPKLTAAIDVPKPPKPPKLRIGKTPPAGLKRKPIS